MPPSVLLRRICLFLDYGICLPARSALTRFRFYGASEYLEDFLARVDAASQVNSFHPTFFNQLAFDLSQLPRFVSRTKKIKEHCQATIAFDFMQGVKLAVVYDAVL